MKSSGLLERVKYFHFKRKVQGKTLITIKYIYSNNTFPSFVAVFHPLHKEILFRKKKKYYLGINKQQSDKYTYRKQSINMQVLYHFL